jgi:vacuolar-type H+-ATPase subunit E/Vma4
MGGKKEDIKIQREQIQADERRINVMKIKLIAKVKIFEDQRQRYQARMEILEKDLEVRKKLLQAQERTISQQETQLVEKLVDIRNDNEVSTTSQNGQSQTPSSEPPMEEIPPPDQSQEPPPPNDDHQ